MPSVEAHSQVVATKPRRRRTAGASEDRALRIGVLSLSGHPETGLIEPLSRAALPIHPIRIRLGTAKDSAAEIAFIRGAPVSFTRAILDEPLDGLILAGTPEDDAPVIGHARWRELTEILEYARGFVPSTLGLGMGGVALAEVLGVEAVRLAKPLSGLMPLRAMAREHRLLAGESEVFFAAQERHFRLSEASVANAIDERRITVLARSSDAGVTIFESADRRFIGHLGRPEGEPKNASPGVPSSAFQDSARESAREHARAFFSAWIGRLCDVAVKNRIAR